MMSHDAIEFFAHRFLALLPVAGGYLVGRLAPTPFPVWMVALWFSVGLLAGAASWVVLGDAALPIYHPLYFFTVLGLTAVVTSRTARRSSALAPEALEAGGSQESFS